MLCLVVMGVLGCGRFGIYCSCLCDCLHQKGFCNMRERITISHWKEKVLDSIGDKRNFWGEQK